MLLKILRSKIHRATITEACIDYMGSITIDEDLMEAVDIRPGQCVLVSDMTDGARFETYVMAGERGSGVICINGAAARLVNEGDEVIVMAFAYIDAGETADLKPRIALVDKSNRLTETR